MSRTFLLAALLLTSIGGAALGQPPAREERDVKGRKKPALPFREVRLPPGRASEFVFSPDGARVAVGAGSVITVWNVADGAEVVRMQLPKEQSWQNVTFADGGKTLVYHGGEDPIARVFDVKTGRQVREFPQPGSDRKERVKDKEGDRGFSTRFLGYSPDGTRAVYSNSVKGVDVVEITTGKLFHVPEDKWWRGWSFTPDGMGLVFCSAEDGIRFRDARTGKLVKLLRDPPRVKGSGSDRVVLSPDGNFLAAWGQPCTAVDIWDVRAGKRVCTVRTHTYCYTVRFSRDNQSLLIYNNRSETQLYHIVAEKTVHTIYSPNTLATCIAFTPDQKRIVILAPAEGPGAAGRYSLFIHELPAKLLDPAAARFDDAAPAKLWPELLGDNELRLDLARRALRGAPKEAVALFRKELLPVDRERQKQVERLLADLDDDNYLERDLAVERLRGTAHAFAPLLRARHQAARPGEVRNRLTFVLGRMDNEKPPASLVREMRGVAILEQLATPEARALLAELSRGAPDALLTREASAALARLGKAGAR